jgi:hypothetical protein
VVRYASLGVHIERGMTDNGTGYKKLFGVACKALGIRHIKTRPYTPRTNGKAERFAQTRLREWANAQPYESSAQREAASQPFLHRYNWHRPHAALNHRPPMSRIPAMNNLLKLNSQSLCVAPAMVLHQKKCRPRTAFLLARAPERDPAISLNY